jgi:transposase
MQIPFERWCGLDVHTHMVVACWLTAAAAGNRCQDVRRLSPMTQDLLALADWLTAAGGPHGAMASTGGFGKPISTLLAGLFAWLLVNAQHLQAVPGRKSDVRAAAWRADLLQHGCLRASFIPPPPQRDRRALPRSGRTLGEERARMVNRVQKSWEDATLKLAAGATDRVGQSARAMLERLLAGPRDPEALAALAKGRMPSTRAPLEQALTGRLRAQHGLLLGEPLSRIDEREAALLGVRTELGDRLRSLEEELPRLDTIPGSSRRTAEVLLAEMGTEMSPFPSAHHLAWWAGMGPGNHESAGQRPSGQTRKGSRWLKQVVLEAAPGAARTKDPSLSAQYHRLAGRKGRKKALGAVGHRIVVIAYPVLSRREPDRE